MHIYIDFDDCLCETAAYFTQIARKLFGKEIAYEDIKDFNLQKSFELTDDQYGEMMEYGHRPQILGSIPQTDGAAEVVGGWIRAGHRVSIITGRPASSFEPSRKWLDRHGLEGAELFCLNKYGRDSFIKGASYSLKLEDYYKMKFDFAVEDSPLAFKYLTHLPDLRAAIVDRPWNRGCALPGENYRRCRGWEEIQQAFADAEKALKE